MKKISTLQGVMSTLDAMAHPESLEKVRKDVFRDELPGGCVVDTCVGFDTGIWETGIAPTGDSYTITEQYPNRDAAKTGHDKWVQSMKDNPTQELTDVNVWGDL